MYQQVLDWSILETCNYLCFYSCELNPESGWSEQRKGCRLDFMISFAYFLEFNSMCCIVADLSHSGFIWQQNIVGHRTDHGDDCQHWWSLTCGRHEYNPVSALLNTGISNILTSFISHSDPIKCDGIISSSFITCGSWLFTTLCCGNETDEKGVILSRLSSTWLSITKEELLTQEDILHWFEL